MSHTSLNHQFLDAHEFLSYLGISIETQKHGKIVLTVPHQAKLTNPGNDVMQGGVVATMVDHAAGAALRTTFDSRPVPFHASTDLNVSFLQPATDDLVVTGTVLRAGGTMGVVTVDIETPDGVGIAAGRVSLAIRRNEAMPGTEPDSTTSDM